MILFVGCGGKALGRRFLAVIGLRPAAVSLFWRFLRGGPLSLRILPRLAPSTPTGVTSAFSRATISPGGALHQRALPPGAAVRAVATVFITRSLRLRDAFGKPPCSADCRAWALDRADLHVVAAPIWARSEMTSENPPLLMMTLHVS